MEKLLQNFQDILDTIEDSLRKERIVPSLILIYSGIDNISHLAETEEKADGTIFKEWVKNGCLKNTNFLAMK